MEETPKIIRNENCITIQGWMVNKLNLKGNELMTYAVIYGFTQIENQAFTGSLQYIANWLNSSKETARQCLKSLVEKDLLVKEEEYINGVKFCRYYTKNLVGIQDSGINNIIKENNKNNNILNSFNIHNEEDILNSSNILNELFLLKENQKKIEKENEELKKRAKTKSKEFVPPTLEEVKQYCLERNNKLDYKYFYDYFTEGNWKDSNGNQVKNWKQKIITWEKNKINKQEEHKQSQGIVYEQLN